MVDFSSRTGFLEKWGERKYRQAPATSKLSLFGKDAFLHAKIRFSV
jgi:hypothetical protein